MRITGLQFHALIGDVRGNAERVLGEVQAAAAAGASVVVTPELALTGYPPRDLLEHVGLRRQCQEAMAWLADALPEGVDLLLGAPWPAHGARLYNAVVHLRSGSAPALAYAKCLLPWYDVFDDPRYFVPGPAQDPVLALQGMRLGLTVCEDLWWEEGSARTHYPVDPLEALARADVDLVLNLAASPFETHKVDRRLRHLSYAARTTRAPVLYVNAAGCHDNLLFDGQSMLVSSTGELLHAAPAFEECALAVHWPTPEGDPLASRVAAARPRNVEPAGPTLSAHHLAPTPAPAQHHRALCEGIRDYVRKTGFSQVLIGLSGGIDSAVVATLAVDALGAANVRGIAMPSPYSSDHSLEDARALADRLGIRLDEVPLEPAMQSLDALLNTHTGAPSSGLAHENLQSRLRGLLLMTLSNSTGALVLTTGNKSEVAVGYCTLYGDMCGALAPIADLYKTEVFALAEHLNQPTERIPERTLTKPPSAELRPDQRDEDSLPPYAVLDPILQAILEEGADRATLLASGHDPDAVNHTLRLVIPQEYKRSQYAPVLRVSPRAFGTGWRQPLARRHPDQA